MPIPFHFPHNLLSLLIETIPLLCRSKKDVILFFKGAGVDQATIGDLEKVVLTDKDSINKYEITRTVLQRLNEAGDKFLSQRRQVIKRIIDFEDFYTCWENDQLKAKGLVCQIRQVVDEKDTFTRINIEREREAKARKDEFLAKQAEQNRKREERLSIKRDFYDLFKETDTKKRGKKLEGVLNRFFSLEGILIREAFTVRGENTDEVFEQIDGLVDIDGRIFLVEMKWWQDKLGREDVSSHLVRIYGRDQAHGIFISNSDFTDSGLNDCKTALTHKVVVLSKLEEIVHLLEREESLIDFLRKKIQRAIVDKEPFFQPLKEAA